MLSRLPQIFQPLSTSVHSISTMSLLHTVHHSTGVRKMTCNASKIFQPVSYSAVLINLIILQKSDKSQIYYWSSQTALGSGSWLIDCWWLTMLKNLKTALFQTFSTWHRILSAFTALLWPSTAFYWPSTTKYQPVLPYTDPVPSWINHYGLILIQCQ